MLYIYVLIFYLYYKWSKKMKNLILTFLITFLSVNTYSIDINGEAYAFTGNVSSITLNESGGVINAVGQTGQYGKVWLTYNLKADNPGNPNQGSFSGRATAIDENGNRNGASRQGVWERKGTVMHFRSLDDVSDGNQYLCITAINLINDSLKMSFYSTK